MPEQAYPPFISDTGARIQPRQLNRWLDVSPQNGPLQRTMSFLTFPAFSITFPWLGYSNLVGAINVTSTNNFVLKLLNFIYPINPNYTLCIMWEDSLGNVFRYSLWRASNDIIYFTLPSYNGQLIKKNFRFEIWNTPSIPSVNATEIDFFTSSRGSYDYMWANDFPLGNDSSLITNFSESELTATLPSNAQNLLLNRFVTTQNLIVGGGAAVWTNANAGTAILKNVVSSSFTADLTIPSADSTLPTADATTI